MNIKQELIKVADNLNSFCKIGGYSNEQQLLQRGLSKLEEVIDEIYPSGKFWFWMIPIEEGKKPEKGTPKVTVYLSQENSSQVTRSATGWKILIDSSDGKELVYKTLAHELTHISQNFNSFMFFEHEGFYKRIKEKNIKKKNIGKFYDIEHNERKTEQEAVVVGIATLLNRKQYKLAFEEMKSRSEYFQNIDTRTFYKKLVSMNVEKEAISYLKSEFIKELNDYRDFYKKTFNINKIDSVGDCFFELKEIIPLLKLFNIGYKNEAIELLNDAEYIAKNDENYKFSRYNFDNIIKILKNIV